MTQRGRGEHLFNIYSGFTHNPHQLILDSVECWGFVARSPQASPHEVHLSVSSADMRGPRHGPRFMPRFQLVTPAIRDPGTNPRTLGGLVSLHSIFIV